MARSDLAERRDPGARTVQARNEMERLAAGRQIGVTAFHIDFFQRFQTVRSEARAENIHTRRAAPAKLLQRGRRVGLKPFGLAETGLESRIDRGTDRPDRACGAARRGS